MHPVLKARRVYAARPVLGVLRGRRGPRVTQGSTERPVRPVSPDLEAPPDLVVRRVRKDHREHRDSTGLMEHRDSTGLADHRGPKETRVFPGRRAHEGCGVSMDLRGHRVHKGWDLTCRREVSSYLTPGRPRMTMLMH